MVGVDDGGASTATSQPPVTAEVADSTVVLVMTDVEGSTRLWAEQAAAMNAAMARHHVIIHAAVVRHHGWRPIDQGEGDAVFASPVHSARQRGEHLRLPLPPVHPADSWSETDVRSLAASEAVGLFVTRSTAVRREFQLTSTNAAAIATICSRLDGMPLALELAAARTRMLSPEALLPRLDRALGVLRGGITRGVASQARRLLRGPDHPTAGVHDGRSRPAARPYDDLHNIRAALSRARDVKDGELELRLSQVAAHLMDLGLGQEARAVLDRALASGAPGTPRYVDLLCTRTSIELASQRYEDSRVWATKFLLAREV